MSLGEDATREPRAEPGPNWPVAKDQWKLAWELHWLGFGLLFSLVALYCLVSLTRMKDQKAFARPPIFIAINMLLAFLGLSRSVYLFLDPYQSGEHGVEVPLWLSKVIFALAFPCLTSSFCLLHLAFLEVTKLRVGSPKLSNPRFLLVIVAAHFVIALTAEITTSLDVSTKTLLIVCQCFFVVWGLLLSVGFIYSGTKIIRRRESTRRYLTGPSSSKNVRGGGAGGSNMSKVAKITLIASILGIACSALQLYSLVGVYGFYTTTANVDPWPWWIFQTTFRATEFAMAATLCFSVMQPSERASERGRRPRQQAVVLSELQQSKE